MDADDVIQALAADIYQSPIAEVRDEPNYPDLTNPLHLAILLIDCDSEIMQNGMLGFLENPTGRHFRMTVQALERIGAKQCAHLFLAVQDCLEKYGLTWERLQPVQGEITEFEVHTFSEQHQGKLDRFADEVSQLTGGFSLFNSLYSPEDAYAAFCDYLQKQIVQLNEEIIKRKQ